ncbi:MAG: hypothetical protein V3T22_02630 [Planctomycetota bacterium]
MNRELVAARRVLMGMQAREQHIERAADRLAVILFLVAIALPAAFAIPRAWREPGAWGPAASSSCTSTSTVPAPCRTSTCDRRS